MYDIKLEPVFKSIKEFGFYYIIWAELNFQEAESIHICFALLLDRIKTFIDKVHIPVDKLETQYLRKSTQPYPNILLLQLTKQYSSHPIRLLKTPLRKIA